MRYPQIDRIGAVRMGFALLLAVALAIPGVARASAQWEYPLLPHVPALAFMPSTPNDVDPTSVVLSAVYAQECWDAGEIAVSDPAHVAIRLTGCTLMPDSVSGWVRQASLGVLSAGMHSLTVRANIRTAAGDSVTEEITIPFEVVHGAPPPPPPPSDSGSTLLVGVSFDPPAPNLNQPVSVSWSVLFPFTCMSVTSAHAVDATHLEMTLQQSPGCADTTRRWLQRFDLGVLPVGPSYVALDITVITPDSTSHFRTGAEVYVTDPNAPPPPPPIDSLRTTMSATHPNPFRDQTRFSVSLEQPQSAQVMVYDIGGRRVATVFAGLLPAGTSVLAWDGRRSDGSRAAGGIYFYRLSLPGRVVTRRVVLLTTP